MKWINHTLWWIDRKVVIVKLKFFCTYKILGMVGGDYGALWSFALIMCHVHFAKLCLCCAWATVLCQSTLFETLQRLSFLPQYKNMQSGGTLIGSSKWCECDCGWCPATPNGWTDGFYTFSSYVFFFVFLLY